MIRVFKRPAHSAFHSIARIMKFFLLTFALVLTFLTGLPLHAADPLRIFIRSGPKSHGPGQHDYPQFLKEWTALLSERGASVKGKEGFPTAQELDNTDVLILHAQEAGNIAIGEERKNLLNYLKRGGGIVVIHAGAVSRDPEWFKTIVGGSWKYGKTKFLEGHMSLYFTDRENPITRDVSNFDIEDEIYYDMELLPDIKILAAAYTPNKTGARDAKKAEASTQGGKQVSIYDIQPQIWTYEKDAYRSVVFLPGHLYDNFSHNSIRTLLLRSIAWAGKRENVDELCKPEELGDALRYAVGGPSRPQEAVKKIEVHPDFDISLVAAEPLINKAMNLDWDDKGRLWVVETPEYPNGLRQANVDAWKESGSVKPGNYEREPLDRISILTDTNGDGVMDKKHVFADKLELATSFVLYKNGVLVSAAPDIWYLEDTDGDDVADKRTKVYTGLGTGDTHAVMNNLRWGLDGWVYATHGYSAGDVTALGKPNAEPVRISSGVVRFRPDGSAIEMYSSKGGNTWGLDITWDGQVFWTQPTSGTVFFHTVLPEYILAKGKIPGTDSYKGMITGQKTYPSMSWPQQAYVQIDQVGAFTAAAGCAIYEGGTWPEKWSYSYFTTEPTVNIVHHEFVKKDGVSVTPYKEAGREETEFMRSTDLWFRPIETRIGPDGALYVIDFYNQAVIHNDTRGPIHGPANAAVRPDRDHYFGRIWKIQHKQAKKLTVPVLEKDNVKSLVQTIETNPNAHVKKLAWRLIQESGKGGADVAKIKPEMGSAAEHLYHQFDGSSNYEAALKTFVEATDDWSRSAIIAVASSGNSVAWIKAGLASPYADKLSDFAVNVLPAVVNASADHSAALIIACTENAGRAVALKKVVLQGLAQQIKGHPKFDDKLFSALKSLLSDSELASAVLPLVARLDQNKTLVQEMGKVQEPLLVTLKDSSASTDARLAAARSLLQMPEGVQHPQVYAVLGELLAHTESSHDLQIGLMAILDDTPANRGASYLVDNFAVLPLVLKTPAFDIIVKRPRVSIAFLKAIEEDKIAAKDIGPGNVARLRTHPDKAVASMAASLMEKLSPQTREKNDVIARLLPEVTRPGNVANGKMMFTAACSICHKLGDIGIRDVGPPLAGMGAHGAAELLVHIVDPNREVDPSFWQWNITTKKGDTLVGVITSENAASVNLRNQGGDFDIRKDDIASRENTRRSLMPEGLEALGPDALRDILAFMAEGDSKFRVLDLRDAYTADARRGLFATEEKTSDSVFPTKFGNVTVEGIPFFLMDPARSSNGRSLVVLKGGGKDTVANVYPQKVEISTDVTAKRLHLLSGIAGWGWPAVKDDRPALKLTIEHTDGEKEVTELRNSIAFADYNREIEVPGSTLVSNVVSRGQLRLISVEVRKPSSIKRVTLESYDNGVTPVVVAMTADVEGRAGKVVNQAPAKPAAASATGNAADGPKEGGKGDGPMVPAAGIQWESNKTKVLVIGGGSAHDFATHFGTTDVATLRAAGFSVNYTEDRDQATQELANADVAVVSVNRRFFDTAAYRKAFMDFAASGKGIIMLHPGTWYAYPQWPELNARIVGGGSRGHDRLGEFKVNVVKKDHPVMKGIPESFSVVDELYYVNAENVPEGTTPIEVLAETSPSQKYRRPHPSVWLAQHPQAKVVNIALGHDARVHEMEAFKKLLVNSVQFVKH